MSHIDPETLAAFAEGRVSRIELAPLLAHLRRCQDCMSDVEALKEPAPRQAPRTWWLAAAAALVIVAAATFLIVRNSAGRDPMQRLVSLASHTSRTVEPRLSGGFEWAPYRGPMRADVPDAEAGRMQLTGAAGDAVAHADADRGAEAQRVAGVALLLIERPNDAVTRLRAAAEKSPNDARTWSDLAAALDDAAIRMQHPSLHPEALAAADRALRIDANSAAALFNRALILEHLGLTSEARSAWERYLRVDASSPWANEAREHLRQLPVSTGENLFRQEQPRLERAALAGDVRAVEELVSHYPQQSRAFGEAEYLGRWGESGSNDALTIARAIGDALQKHSGESMLHDAVQAIDCAGTDKSVCATRRATIATAHATYRHARLVYAKHQPAAAEPELRRAAALFAAAGDPMSLVARYFAACTRYDGDDVPGARAELASLVTESAPRYRALNAQIRWQLALTYMADADWNAALAQLQGSESLFRALGEQSNLGFIRGLQATSLSSHGRADEAWSARIQSFRILTAEGRGDRLLVTLGGAMWAELSAGRLDPARGLLEIEVAANREAHNDIQLATALLGVTLVSTQLGDSRAASNAAGELETIAAAVRDPSLRGPVLADANVAGGAAAMQRDPHKARELLTSAIDFYRRSERSLFLPQAQLLRARAALQLGDRAAAARDLDDGWSEVERHRVRVAGAVGATDILDAGNALGREAIRLRFDDADAAAAFDAMERRDRQIGSDSRSITLAELQKRLARSDTAVLMLSMLPSEVAALCVTASEIVKARVPVSERALDTSDERALYDLLIRPVKPALARARRLIVVPDPLLQQVPFAALYDSVAHRYLIEDMPVAVAPNASSLRDGATAAKPRSVVAVALPYGSMATLPDVQQELTEVCALYPAGRAIEPESSTFSAVSEAARRADVVHIAGHTANGADDRALQFRAAEGTERISWRELAALHLPTAPVVIVAGCETLRSPDARQTRGLSLGGGFLAAGAADVIGTLAPIADRDARDFFRGVHRRMAAGIAAADALRLTQIDAIATETATHQHSAWRAVALITSHF